MSNNHDRAKEVVAFRCPFCHDTLSIHGGEWVACQTCLARHHVKCWTEAGSCSSCKESKFFAVDSSANEREAAPAGSVPVSVGTGLDEKDSVLRTSLADRLANKMNEISQERSRRAQVRQAEIGLVRKLLTTVTEWLPRDCGLRVIHFETTRLDWGPEVEAQIPRLELRFNSGTVHVSAWNTPRFVCFSPDYQCHSSKPLLLFLDEEKWRVAPKDPGTYAIRGATGRVQCIIGPCSGPFDVNVEFTKGVLDEFLSRTWGV